MERVLGFAKANIKSYAFPNEQKVWKGTEEYHAILHEVLSLCNLSYLDRPLAEKDESFAQLIPYCVLEQEGMYFAYQRTKKGGENRLHDLWSVGVGGHINPADAHNVEPHPYVGGFKRELEEEVGLTPDQYTNEVIGCLYDGSNEVGRVHFGIIELVHLHSSCLIHPTDPALSKGCWFSLDKLKEMTGQFEGWSQLVIDHLLPG